MGLRFRKSFKIGVFRVNLSTRGVGWSVGVPGYRKTFKAGGGTRTTYSVPGTGISYVEDKSAKKAAHGTSADKTRIKGEEDRKTYDFANDLKETSQNEFVKKLNKAQAHNKYRKLALALFGIFGAAFFCSVADDMFYLIPAILCVAGFIFFLKKASVSLDIEMEEEIKRGYEELCRGFERISQIERILKIDSYSVGELKKLSVAGTPVKVGKNNIDCLESNDEFFCMQFGKTSLCFLPNVVLFRQNKKWIAVEYAAMKTGYADVEYIERGSVASDTVALTEEYEHANKDGSADKRYKYNPLITVCGYGCVGMESSNGLQLYLLTSDREKAHFFADRLSEYSENKIVSGEE